MHCHLTARYLHVAWMEVVTSRADAYTLPATFARLSLNLPAPCQYVARHVQGTSWRHARHVPATFP